MKQIGDFVETIHGVNGILTKVKKGRLLWRCRIYCDK